MTPLLAKRAEGCPAIGARTARITISRRAGTPIRVGASRVHGRADLDESLSAIPRDPNMTKAQYFELPVNRCSVISGIDHKGVGHMTFVSLCFLRR
jgi:hypothetical protein